MTTTRRLPQVVAITNENPDWPEIDKVYADEMWQPLLEGLKQAWATRDASPAREAA